jgi:protein gp37
MGEATGIEWTEHTWNPWVGCTQISPGCDQCYMFSGMRRFGRDPEAVVRTKRWGDPLKWSREAASAGRIDRVFTCSWSDWFHKAADAWRDEAWMIVASCQNLDFQILTKRSARIAGHLPYDWYEGYRNVWLGVSIEEQARIYRVDRLARIPAAVRFISAEPLLGPLDFKGALQWNGIHWVIVGGESGHHARPCRETWIRDIVQQCADARVACFVKQFGSNPEQDFGPDCKLRFIHPKGGDPDEWPEDLRVREFPTAAIGR